MPNEKQSEGVMDGVLVVAAGSGARTAEESKVEEVAARGKALCRAAGLGAPAGLVAGDGISANST